VRSSSTQFRLDHFRAQVFVGPRAERPRIDIAEGHVELDSKRDLYGPLLFHTGRFQGVKRYRRLTATECVAEIAPCNDPFFHRYLPPQLLLGDATIRDAAIHALQGCVPQATVLPAGIDSIELFAPVEGETIVVAHETARHADGFAYDVDLTAPDGRLFERWRGLRLQIVARRERVDDLAPALWGPFLERELSVTVRVGATDAPMLRRHDGKPLLPNGHVSKSHDGEIALIVSHEKPVGVDVQQIAGQPWDDIIAPHDGGLADVCTRLSGDDRPYAAARVWSARESMKKLAGDALVPLIVDTCGSHGRVTFRSGPHRIDTFVMRDCVVAVAKERV
jgi:enediyne polyketide synthase